MTERSYLFGYGSGPWGSATRKTKTQILASSAFDHVHPEHMRRMFAIADAVIDAGSDFGFGGGDREFAEQDAEFRKRHFTVPCPGGIWRYAGACWQRYTWAAPYAPPGNSWHEAGASTRGALAVDALGDHTRATPLCQRFGLVNGISGELWHYQPLEIPHARSFGQVWGELAVWPLPGGLIVADSLKLKDYRLYDSRESDGKLSGDRTLGVTDGEAAGAVALQANITIVDTEASGFLSVWRAGEAWPGTSKANWTGPDQVDANEVTIPLNSFGQFSVKVGPGLAKTNFVIDVVGYWMP